MTGNDRPDWHLSGAGNMGCMALDYLQRGGLQVAVLAAAPGPALQRILSYEDGRPARQVSAPVVARDAVTSPISRLLVACKTPYSAAALAGLPLADDVLVVRLQNGIGSLDGLLPAGARRVEMITTNAAYRTRAGHHVVAENQTWAGDGEPPPRAIQPLLPHWPGLCWSDDIRSRQWSKLVVNSVINPLTALHDVRNGKLVDDAALAARMALLATEADRLLNALDARWPQQSHATVIAVARATAGNTSSMRADIQRGARTEIDAINGWLLTQAERIGLELPAHRAVVADIRRLSLQAHSR